MGYSIRDDRWRLTLWRDRKDNAIHATELYDEVGDPHETVNVAAKPEHAEVIARLTKFLPPPIAPATDKNTAAPAGKKGKKGKAKAEESAAPKAAATKDRGAMFDGRDVNKDGKLSKEEFMDKQKDPAHAAENYIKFDKDKDTFLTKEEFVKMGK
jgi:hypothetical protein